MMITLNREEIEAACITYLESIHMAMDTGTVLFRNDTREIMQAFTMEVELYPDNEATDGDEEGEEANP